MHLSPNSSVLNARLLRDDLVVFGDWVSDGARQRLYAAAPVHAAVAPRVFVVVVGRLGVPLRHAATVPDEYQDVRHGGVCQADVETEPAVETDEHVPELPDLGVGGEQCRRPEDGHHDGQESPGDEPPTADEDVATARRQAAGGDGEEDQVGDGERGDGQREQQRDAEPAGQPTGAGTTVERPEQRLGQLELLGGQSPADDDRRRQQGVDRVGEEQNSGRRLHLVVLEQPQHALQ